MRENEMVNWESSHGNSASLGLVGGNNVDIASRIFIAIFGVAWAALSNMNVGMGMRDLTFSFREWLWIGHSVAGLLLIVLSCSPRYLLNNRLISWSFACVVIFVEISFVLIMYRNFVRFYGLYGAPQTSSDYIFEVMRGLMTRSIVGATIMAVAGVALGLSAGRLLLRPKQSLPH